MVSFTYACSNPRTVMVHPLYTNSTLIAVTGSIRPINIASRTEFEPDCHLSYYAYVGHYNIVADVVAFGDRHKILINFISIFLLIELGTIF